MSSRENPVVKCSGCSGDDFCRRGWWRCVWSMCLRCGTVDSGVSSFRSSAVKLEAAKAVEAMGRVSSSVDEVKTCGSFMWMSRRVCFFWVFVFCLGFAPVGLRPFNNVNQMGKKVDIHINFKQIIQVYNCNSLTLYKKLFKSKLYQTLWTLERFRILFFYRRLKFS